ncbi:hypothetical protein SAMN05428983_4977 [Agrobacterium fabrum]|uniref:Uncharacterized protein n=1 Tax=Agrobacterium fabrum TaxID=1176649 RepID=A0A7Z7FSD2_9HYPH|nr:hypothetical protein SAMN05428983_4977 [Agrobacterium fabrum]
MRTKRSFDDSSSERLRVIKHETGIINLKLCCESAEQALIAIAPIWRQASVALFCPLGQQITVNLIWKRDVGDHNVAAFLRLKFQALDWKRVGRRCDADVDVDAASQIRQGPVSDHVTPVSATIGFYVQAWAADIYDPNLARLKVGVGENIVVTAIRPVPSSSHNPFENKTIIAFTVQAVLKPVTFPVLPPNDSHRRPFRKHERNMNIMVGMNDRKAPGSICRSAPKAAGSQIGLSEDVYGV